MVNKGLKQGRLAQAGTAHQSEYMTMNYHYAFNYITNLPYDGTHDICKTGKKGDPGTNELIYHYRQLPLHLLKNNTFRCQEIADKVVNKISDKGLVVIDQQGNRHSAKSTTGKEKISSTLTNIQHQRCVCNWCTTSTNQNQYPSHWHDPHQLAIMTQQQQAYQLYTMMSQQQQLTTLQQTNHFSSSPIPIVFNNFFIGGVPNRNNTLQYLSSGVSAVESNQWCPIEVGIPTLERTFDSDIVDTMVSTLLNPGELSHSSHHHSNNISDNNTIEIDLSIFDDIMSIGSDNNGNGCVSPSIFGDDMSTFTLSSNSADLWLANAECDDSFGYDELSLDFSLEEIDQLLNDCDQQID